MNVDGQTAPSRVTGFASAVLLVLLLATSGWPDASPQAAVEQQVTSSEVAPARGAFRKIEREERARFVAVCFEVEPPRVAPRQARVDSWGLPPPRAPASARS